MRFSGLQLLYPYNVTPVGFIGKWRTPFGLPGSCRPFSTKIRSGRWKRDAFGPLSDCNLLFGWRLRLMNSRIECESRLTRNPRPRGGKIKIALKCQKKPQSRQKSRASRRSGKRGLGMTLGLEPGPSNPSRRRGAVRPAPASSRECPRPWLPWSASGKRSNRRFAAPYG